MASVAEKYFLKKEHETGKNFTSAMSGSVAQVSVVTTDGPAGKFGVTISAFASVSAEPPLVLVCINQRSPAIAAIDENNVFCVNLLNDSQNVFADCFAGRPCSKNNYEFADTDWQKSLTGSPALPGATANFDCVVETSHIAGTHRIFIGRVRSATATQNSALAFSQRNYQGVAPLND